ncbi:MAG TPA: carboxypeptidase regulatory-like domain-containing protein [Verrucomicrobiae bacterium]|nr:carboxypeptidase regulatory-like domain-containing protein [Verrucomicrobiae bacterium]
MKAYRYLFLQFAVSLLMCAAVFAQISSSDPAQSPSASQTPAAAAQTAGTGALRGQVTDPSAAVIPGATVTMTPQTGSPIKTQTDAQGFYQFRNLPAGKYSLTVVAQGFTQYQNNSITIGDQPLRLNVTMNIEVETQKVQVSDTAPTVDVSPTNNAGAITISGKELDALPDDPDELESDLQALAGPSAGPNGGQMYIDGFTAGQLPPKASIREIRINQNPFSSEYDKLGYGRIEIFTKPGMDKLHGQLLADGNDSPFNSPNPFALGVEPPYYSTFFNGSIGGAIDKKASFFVSADRRDINELSVINATDPTTGNIFGSSISNPRERTNVGPRIDWAITPNNTLTARYQYYRDTETGTLGSANYLATQAYYTKSTEDTVQLSDTQVFGTKIVNETRFQFNRDNNVQNPNDTNPAVIVQGNFVGGGNSEGTLNDLQNAYELQNYTSVIHGNHTIKFGARLRATTDSDYSTSGFNGTFTFLPSTGPFTGMNPAQLSITIGSPNASVNYTDFEPYIQDDWRALPNLTISTGLRFETQNHIHDHADWAPRFGFAYGVHGRNNPPIVVIRGGAGIFYDRFQLDNILQAQRLNGVTQTEYVVDNPTCFPGLDTPLNISNISDCVPSGSNITAIPTTYQISPTLHAPYTVQGALSVERQVTKTATLSVTYLDSRGFDQFVTINAGAPYPGTPCYPNCPAPTQNLYRYVSEANFSQHQLMMNSNVRIGTKVQLFGYYSLNFANSDTGGVSTFPSNSYDIKQDYGRAPFDTRNRLFLGGSIGLPYLFRLSPFMVVSSGTPFNITSPIDLNGDQSFNDRPGLVSTATCPTTSMSGNIYCTPLGTFDVTGATGRPLPINYGTGPNRFVMNLRLSKTFGFGPSTKENAGGQSGGPGGHGGHRGGPLFGGGGPISFSSNSDRRYNLTLSISARNAFNNLNVANPGGVVGSKYFDVSNTIQGFPFSPGTTANRRLDLLATFSF